MKKLRLAAPVAPRHLVQVVAGGDPAAVTPDATDATSNVLKTRHDTVKNTISNVR